LSQILKVLLPQKKYLIERSVVICFCSMLKLTSLVIGCRSNGAVLQKMEGVYGKLCKKYPDMAKQSEKKLNEVHENWNRLEDLANAR